MIRSTDRRKAALNVPSFKAALSYSGYTWGLALPTHDIGRYFSNLSTHSDTAKLDSESPLPHPRQTYLHERTPASSIMIALIPRVCVSIDDPLSMISRYSGRKDFPSGLPSSNVILLLPTIRKGPSPSSSPSTILSTRMSLLTV